MYLETSHYTKKLVGRLDEGKELITSLIDACRAHAIGSGSLNLYGSLQAIELVAFQSGSEPSTIFSGKGSFTVLSCDGNIAMFGKEIIIEVRCTILSEGPFGAQIIGGIVKSATINHVDVVISAFDDLIVERKVNFDAGRFTVESFRKKSTTKEPKTTTNSIVAKEIAEPKPVKERSPSAIPTQPDISWDDVAESVAKPKEKKRLIPKHERLAALRNDELSDLNDTESETTIEDAELSAGDILLHPKLGECRVMKVEGEDFARVRLPKGQLRKLSLAICSTEFVEKKNGRNVFNVRINT